MVRDSGGIAAKSGEQQFVGAQPVELRILDFVAG
jgi:hypothetical protein